MNFSSIRYFSIRQKVLLGVLLFLIAPTLSQATIRITEIRGASNYINNTTANSLDIYGGMAGSMADGTCATANGVDTCNSCTNLFTLGGAGNAGCNPARIYDNLTFSISFIVEGSYTGNGRAMIQFSTGGSTYSIISSTTYTVNQVATVSGLWSDICTKMGGTSGCSESLSQSGVKIGLSADTNTVNSDALTARFFVVDRIMSDTDTDSYAKDCTTAASSSGHGACDFEVFPGDEKAWVLDVKVPSAFPTARGSTEYTKVRYYYSDDQTKLVPNFGTYKDMYLNQASPTGANRVGFKDSFVDGLTNGRTYYFMAASVDLAQNIGYFILPTDTSKHIIRPDIVNGLLGSDMSCFIATAAYGSAWAEKVQNFRSFRNQFLLPTDLGRKFVRLYYRYSPKAAAFIQNSDTLRAGTRAVLFPVWAFAQLSLKYGTLWAVSAALFCLVFGFLILRISVGLASTSKD